MLDAETLDLLRRGVIALERLADKFAPAEAQRERRPATLSTAIYDRDKREVEEWKTFRSQEQKSKG